MNINDPEVLKTAQLIQSKPNLLDENKPPISSTTTTTTTSSALNINLSSPNNNKPKPLNITATSSTVVSSPSSFNDKNNNNNAYFSSPPSYQSDYSFYGPSTSAGYQQQQHQQQHQQYQQQQPSYSPAPAPKPAYHPAPHQAPRPNGPRAPAVRGGRGSALLNSAVTTGANLPTCSDCKQLVRGPFVSAIGKIWCPGHFVCAHPSCGISLQDVGFVEENGKLYCERDYEQYFAPVCYKCKTPVLAVRFRKIHFKINFKLFNYVCFFLKRSVHMRWKRLSIRNVSHVAIGKSISLSESILTSSKIIKIIFSIKNKYE